MGATLPDAATEPDPSAERAASRGEQVPDEVLGPGDLVGRFIVHRMLGMGGAGVVYAAHDPELDRTIALKILRHALTEWMDGRTRFLREAQALARLSHPNVISVYDVGAAQGHIFIAMEYIHGQTFADWVAATDPSWPDIVAVLVKAGRGLSAAHAAGLIHRDFKPTNLLVGADGRVVVTDFGLARAVVEAEAGADVEAPDTPDPSRSSAFAESITRTGAVQGTPAYMAPEQHVGKLADARSDQFSFCVTLHEALYREHPFLPFVAPAPQTLARPPDDLRGVPAWLQRTVQRGLGWKPEDRFSSMDALLVALTHEPIRLRRRWRIGLAAAAVALVGGALAVGLADANEPAEDTCTGAREQLAAVWNPAMAARVRASFAATARPYAKSSADRVAQQLDTYGAEWAKMHRATCLATARGEQSADLLDRRMACLSRRLSQVGALVDLFVRGADGKLVDDAIKLAGNLEPLSGCADSAELLSRVSPPVDPARRARVRELERQVDRAELERQAGRLQAAEDASRAVLDAERTLGYALLAAQAGRVLGRSLDELGHPADAHEALVRAQSLAERAGDVRLATQLMLDLLVVVGMREQRPGEAHLLEQLAEAALERPGLRDDQEMRAQLVETLGMMATEEGRFDRAVALQRQVLEIRRRLLPAISVEVANAEHNLGNALSHGHFDEARTHYLDALDIVRRMFGDEHPRTAGVHISLGLLRRRQGNLADARRHYLAALAILQRLPTHRAYPLVLNNLGALENITGNRQQARAYHEAALAVRVRQLGPDHPDVAVSLHNLGNVLGDSGDFAEALSLHRRALAIKETTQGADHPSYAISLMMVGEDLRRLGRAPESLMYQRRALKILRAASEDRSLVGSALAYQGLSLIDLGRRREAIPVLERALEMTPASEPTRAEAAFALARSLEPRRPRSRRARALAEEALKIFDDMHRRERSEVAAYLARGGPRLSVASP